MIAKTRKTPYYAVIFSSLMKVKDKDYEEMAEKMLALANRQPGFLGFESAREELGISVSYWESKEAIEKWRRHPAHLLAQEKGKSDWYEKFAIRICKVESDSFWGV